MKKHIVDMSVIDPESEVEESTQGKKSGRKNFNREKLREIKECGGFTLFQKELPVAITTPTQTSTPTPITKEKYLVMVEYTHYFDITSVTNNVSLHNKELNWLPVKYWYKFLIRGNHTLLAVTKEGEPAARWILDGNGVITPAPRKKVDSSGKIIPEKYNLRKLALDIFDIPSRPVQSPN